MFERGCLATHTEEHSVVSRMFRIEIQDILRDLLALQQEVGRLYIEVLYT